MQVWCLGWEDTPGGGNGSPFQYSCLENPWTEEPGGLQPMGSQRARHGLATEHMCMFSPVDEVWITRGTHGWGHITPMLLMPPSSGPPLGQSYRILCGKLKRLWAAEFGLRKLNPVLRKQGHRCDSYFLLLKLSGMLLWIQFEKYLKILLWPKRQRYHVCNGTGVYQHRSQYGSASVGGNRYENMIKSLTFVMKMSGTSELLVLHRNGYTFKITSTFPWVISYVPLVLGFQLHQVDQDLQARPKHMGGKEMVSLIFTISICWRCKRRLSWDYLYSLWSCYSRFSL